MLGARVQGELEMIGRLHVAEPIALDALKLEVLLMLFTVDLPQMRYLLLECWDGLRLREMLLARVVQNSSSPWAADIVRHHHDIFLKAHQNIAVLDARMDDVVLQRQGTPLPDAELPLALCSLIDEYLKEISDINALLGLIRQATSDLCSL